MAFTRILCPIDFSAGSAEALRVAARLAGEANAELRVMHSGYIPAVAFSELTFPADLVQEIHDDAKRGLEQAVQDAKQAGAKIVTPRLVSGLPWLAITEEANDPSCSLVVIGTHGRTGVSRVLLGSVAEKVVRHAQCPVLVVRPDATAKNFEHVLCPIDFSEVSREAMSLAASLAKAHGGGVTLLHAIEIPIITAHDAPPLDFMLDLDRRTAQQLDNWALELERSAGVPVKTLVRTGRAGTEILDVLDNDPTYDLVVMGSHGRTGIKRVLLGSVAEKVVRHSRCPVLIARKPG